MFRHLFYSTTKRFCIDFLQVFRFFEGFLIEKNRLLIVFSLVYLHFLNLRNWEKRNVLDPKFNTHEIAFIRSLRNVEKSFDRIFYCAIMFSIFILVYLHFLNLRNWETKFASSPKNKFKTHDIAPLLVKFGEKLQIIFPSFKQYHRVHNGRFTGQQ